MFVGVATFELHIEQAQSLKDKRMVVKSLRDRIRNKFEVSAAEVGLQELHQRSRIGVAVISNDGASVERILESVAEFIESHGEARLVGSSNEVIQFDEEAPLDIPGL